MPPRPPVSRARTPQGRHARTGPNAPARGRHAAPPKPAPPPAPPPSRARRAAAGARSTLRNDVRPAARTGYQRGRSTAQFVTQRKGGQHALMAEFLFFVAIVGFRAVADYVPGDQGQPTEGTTKGAVTPRNNQLGPLPVLAAGMVVFFVLSFLAARGGTWARVAAVSGLIIDTALLMKSLPELGTVSQAFGNVTQAQAAAQPYPATYVQPVGYEGTATVPGG